MKIIFDKLESSEDIWGVAFSRMMEGFLWSIGLVGEELKELSYNCAYHFYDFKIFPCQSRQETKNYNELLNSLDVCEKKLKDFLEKEGYKCQFYSTFLWRKPTEGDKQMELLECQIPGIRVWIYAKDFSLTEEQKVGKV